MLPSWCDDSVTVWRAPLVDSRGTQVPDWSAASPHEVGGCSFQPTGSSTDFGDPRQALTIRAYLYAPPGADIKEGDRIEFAGRTYAINGAPLPWKSPTGAASHMQIQLVDWRQ